MAGSFFNITKLKDATTAIERISGMRRLFKTAADDAKLLVKPCKAMAKRVGEVFDVLVEMKRILDSHIPGVCPPDEACLHEIGEALDACHEVLCKLQTGSKLLMSEHAFLILDQFKDAMDKLQASVQQINLPLLNMPSNIWDKVQNISRAKKIAFSLDSKETTAVKEMQGIRTLLKKGQPMSGSERNRAEQLLRTLGLTSEQARAVESRALQLEKVRLHSQLSDMTYCFNLLRKFDDSKGSHLGDFPADDVRIGSLERDQSGELKLWKIRLLRRSIHLTPETESKQNIEFLLNMLGVGSEEARELAKECRHAQSQVKLIDFFINVLRCTEVPAEQLRESLPQHFVCPLSQERMAEPVIIASHEVYERAFIYEWLHKKSKKVCPKTKNRLGNTQLFPNFTLRAEIRLWSLQNGYDVPCKLQGDSLGKLINNWIMWFIDNGEDVHKLAVLCRDAQVSNSRRWGSDISRDRESALSSEGRPHLRISSPRHFAHTNSGPTGDGEVDGSVDGEDDRSGSSTSGSMSGEVTRLEDDGQCNAGHIHLSGKEKKHSRSRSGDLMAVSPSVAPLLYERNHLSPGRRPVKPKSSLISFVSVPLDTTPLYNPLTIRGHGGSPSERLLYRGPSTSTPSSPHVAVEARQLPSSESVLRTSRRSMSRGQDGDSPFPGNSVNSPEAEVPDHCSTSSLEHGQGDQGAKPRYTENTRHIVNGLKKLPVSELVPIGNILHQPFPSHSAFQSSKTRDSGRRLSIDRECDHIIPGESRLDRPTRMDVEVPFLDSHGKGYDSKNGLEPAEMDAAVNAIGWVDDDGSDALKVSKEEVSEPAINRAYSALNHYRHLTTNLSWSLQDHPQTDLECLEASHYPGTDSCTPVEPNADSAFFEGGEERVPSKAKIADFVRKAHPRGPEGLEEGVRAINTLRRLAKNVPESRVLICELGGVEMMEAILEKVHPSSSHGMNKNCVKVLEDTVATALNVSIEAGLKIRIARSEILPHLVRLLEDAPTEEVREITAETFRSLSRDDADKSKDLIRERGGIPALISALQQENRTECLGSAVLKTMSAMSVNRENCVQMASEGVIPIALKIAQQPGNPMVYPAVSVVHNLMSIPMARLKVVEMRGVSVLFDVIQRREGHLLVENAIAILYCIASASEWLQSEVAKVSGIVDTLKQVISDPNSTPRAKDKATKLLNIPMLRQRSNGAELARLHAMNEGVMHER